MTSDDSKRRYLMGGSRYVPDNFGSGWSKTFISHNIETVVVLYNNYKGFRKDIEYIYSEIVSHLRDEGLIFNK